MGTHLSNCQATWRLVEGPEKQRWMFIIRVRDDTVFFSDSPRDSFGKPRISHGEEVISFIIS